MTYLKFSLGIFLVLAASRFIPHPPNFTSLIALSFYVPLIFGTIYIPIVLTSFVITDIFIGFHSTLFFTWGSVVLIGLFSKFFTSLNLIFRIFGATSGALIFFIISNFGVWLSGGYGYTYSGLIECYFLAIPFFYNTLISTIIYAFLIESIFFIYKKKFQTKINFLS